MALTIEQRLERLERALAARAAAEQPTSYYTSRYTGEEIDERLDAAGVLGKVDTPQKALANIGGRPRKKLIHNWYFAGGGSQQGGGQFPINPLGATSYPSENSKNRYTIGNWYFAGGGKLNVLPDCIEFPSDPLYRYLATQQTFDLPVDGSYTISALTPDGLEWKTLNKLTNTGLTLSNGIYVYYSSEKKIVIRTPQNQVAQLLAVNLEQGEGQTLGYQDSTGAWKLFETPDYLETLQQCQRYLYAIGNPDQIFSLFPCAISADRNNIIVTIPVGVEMAKTINLGYTTMIVRDSTGVIFDTKAGGTFTPSLIFQAGNSVYIRGVISSQIGTASAAALCEFSGLTLTATD